MKKSVVLFAVLALVVVAAVASAQTTTTEIRRGTVVSVFGNHLVVKGQDGVTREHEVPAGFTFDVDGKKMSVSDLKPGMELTATITTTTTPHVVQTTEIKHGEVLEVVARSMIVRTAEGTRRYTDIPGDFIFYVDGEEKTIYDLKPGMYLTANIVYTSSVDVSQQDIKVAGTAPKAPEPAPALAPAPATTSTYETLPKTGSNLPLAGMVGLLLLAVAAGIALTRRLC